MTAWSSTRARRVLAGLLRIGWTLKRQSGSHRTLTRDGWPDFVFAFHDNEEIGPRMLALIAKRTGLTPSDLMPDKSREESMPSLEPAGMSPRADVVPASAGRSTPSR